MLFESILAEDKSRLIDKLVLPGFEDDPNDEFNTKSTYKNILKSFFAKYPNYENKIDWNKWQTLTKADFDAVMELAKNSNRAKKSMDRVATGIDAKVYFQNTNGREFKIIYENEDWLFVAPLNYQAAVFCDSKECGGAPAKWCIGIQSTSNYWNQFVMDGTKFLMAFSKKFDTMPEKDLFTKLKYMIEYSTYQNDYKDHNIWNQLDDHLRDDQIPKTLSENFVWDIYEQYDMHKLKYKPEEMDKYGNVVVLNPNRINNKIYTPPSEAVGIDFSELHDDKMTDIKGINITSNIKDISDHCFADWWNLEYVNFEDKNATIRIGTKAFDSCSSLEEISFPKYAILGDNIFDYCKNLMKIFIPSEYYDEENEFELLGKTLGKIDWDNPDLQIIPN